MLCDICIGVLRDCRNLLDPLHASPLSSTEIPGSNQDLEDDERCGNGHKPSTVVTVEGLQKEIEEGCPVEGLAEPSDPEGVEQPHSKGMGRYAMYGHHRTFASFEISAKKRCYVCLQTWERLSVAERQRLSDASILRINICPFFSVAIVRGLAADLHHTLEIVVNNEEFDEIGRYTLYAESGKCFQSVLTRVKLIIVRQAGIAARNASDIDMYFVV
jgi:hypothetical protein